MENEEKVLPNQETPENNNEVLTVDTPKEEESVEEVKAEESKDGTFTQEQVNDIIRARLEKAQQRLFNRYGVTNRDELDSLIGKSQSYDVMKEKYADLETKNYELEKELAFFKNNINPERKDDIIAHFKGKGIDFNNDNLVNELSTHPEWLSPVKVEDKPKTTIETLGSDSTTEMPKVSEKDEMAKIFGLSRLI